MEKITYIQFMINFTIKYYSYKFSYTNRKMYGSKVLGDLSADRSIVVGASLFELSGYEMEYNQKHTVPSGNDGSRETDLSSAEDLNSKDASPEAWFKNKRANVLKMYELLPESWLQRIYFYELFLIIGELDGDPRYGITDYFEMIQTRNCTVKTLSTFLNDRIAAGDVVLVPSLKQSRKTYRLNHELKQICQGMT
jgi:hypothetical protein